MTGLFAHNTKTFNNSEDGGCYSKQWIENHEPSTFPARLQGAGYNTFYAGKYLNQYYSKYVPIGYDYFFGLHGNSKYYNYTLNENGKMTKYGDAPDDYLTTIIKNRALDFIQHQSSEKPFFAMVSVPAAHAPFTPEVKYKDFYLNASIPRTENFNVGAKPFKKHWLMTMEPRELPKTVIETIDEFYHRRLETLLSVDDLVEEIILQLNKQNLIDETYIVFTSDNGYHLGQWAMPYDKRFPYETDIRVPMIVRGPNVAYKSVIKSPVLLLDLAPTILDWAKVPINYDDFDGQPFDHLLLGLDLARHVHSDEIQERQMLVEYWGEGSETTYNPECPYRKSQRLSECSIDSACKCQDSWNNTYYCARHLAEDVNFLFCTFEDRELYQEAYDLHEDFYQLENIGYDILPSVQAKYLILIDNLKTCKGAKCRMLK